jgi:hypothetical protein
MTTRSFTRMLTGVAAALLVSVLAPAVARADASCTALIKNKLEFLRTHGGKFKYDLVITSDGDGGNVQYKSGILKWHDGPSLFDDNSSTPTGLVASDRYFLTSKSDKMQLWFLNDSDFTIWDDTLKTHLAWDVDVMCIDEIVVTTVDGARIALAFRAWTP